jgi:hypothetical protein
MLGVLDPHIWLVGIRGNLFFCVSRHSFSHSSAIPEGQIDWRTTQTDLNSLSRRHFLKIWKIPKFKL